jgi:hypothetical protein
MKHLLVLLAILMTAPAQAALRGAPFQPEIDKRFSDLEEDQAEGVAIARKYAKAVYNVATDGGQSGAEKNLGVTLPAGAVITSAWLYVNTAFTKAGGGAGVASLAFQCAGTRDIIAYQSASDLNADSIIGRNVSPTAMNWSSGANIVPESIHNAELQVPSVPTACTIEAVIRGDSGYEAYSAGKATLIIEYFDRD